jgi:hypothetical protein
MPFLIFEAKKQIQLGCFEGKKIKLAKKYGEKQTNKKTIKNKIETTPAQAKTRKTQKNEKEIEKEI